MCLLDMHFFQLPCGHRRRRRQGGPRPAGKSERKAMPDQDQERKQTRRGQRDRLYMRDRPRHDQPPAETQFSTGTDAVCMYDNIMPFVSLVFFFYAAGIKKIPLTPMLLDVHCCILTSRNPSRLPLDIMPLEDSGPNDGGRRQPSQQVV